MADRIEQWRGLVAIAETGSVTAAARRLGLTQSALSKQLAALERRTGVGLVRRTTRTLTLTEAGERVLTEARAAVAAADAADAAATAGDPLSGRVRLSAPANLALGVMMPMLARFAADWPGIAVDARLSDHRVDLAREGIDLAVRVGGLGEARGVRIGTARRIMVAAPAYLARAGAPAALADLAGHACLTYSLLESGSVWEMADGSSVAVGGPFSANDPSALRLAALAGQGIALSATWMFADDLATGRLVAVLPAVRPRDMPIHLVFRPPGPPPPRVALLAEALTAGFAHDPLVAP